MRNGSEPHSAVTLRIHSDLIGSGTDGAQADGEQADGHQRSNGRRLFQLRGETFTRSLARWLHNCRSRAFWGSQTICARSVIRISSIGADLIQDPEGICGWPSKSARWWQATASRTWPRPSLYVSNSSCAPSCDNPLAAAALSLVVGDRAAACMKISDHQARSQRPVRTRHITLQVFSVGLLDSMSLEPHVDAWTVP